MSTAPAPSRRGDRILGALALAASAWLWWAAGGLEASFGDPIGPAAFPRLIAVPTALCAALLLLRPGPDERWWHGRQSLRQLAALGALLLYPPAIEPLGFPLATALGAFALALALGARVGRAALLGALAGPCLFALFDTALGLPLPGWPRL